MVGLSLTSLSFSRGFLENSPAPQDLHHRATQAPRETPALCALCVSVVIDPWVYGGSLMTSIRPLSGITVVEIGHSVAAPYAGMILGELGAEVIKVENPKGGDACRGWGPPFLEGAATCFHAVNRAKQGITIDLRSEERRVGKEGGSRWGAAA